MCQALWRNRQNSRFSCDLHSVPFPHEIVFYAGNYLKVKQFSINFYSSELAYYRNYFPKRFVNFIGSTFLGMYSKQMHFKSA